MSRTLQYYSLVQIRKHISNNNYNITEKAKNDANKFFGWKQKDIVKAILSLKNKHFFKSTKHFTESGIYVDYYKAYNLMNEDVYTHFHIEGNNLIINSFKKI